MIRNQAGQIASAVVLNVSTGAPFVGTVTVYVTIDGGVQALGSVGSGVCAAEGNGLYTYVPTADETNGAHVDFTFVGTGAVNANAGYDTITPGQQSALATATSPLAVPILTIITDAYRGLNIYGSTEDPSPEDAELARGFLNSIFDDWNATRQAVYCEQFTQFTLVPNLSPHTIGPTGTFVIAQRPETIESINWINSGVYTDIPVSTDPEWYSSLPMPGTATSIPLGCYYEKDWPNGKLFFWPVPTTAYVVEFMLRVLLGQVLLTDTFSLPPGYRSAVTLTLQEMLAAAFPGSQTSDLTTRAGKARSRIFNNNVIVPKLATQDAGMPSGRRGASGYDYRSGSWR